MRLKQFLGEGPLKPQANDPVGIVTELNRAIKFIRPQKFPKLDREMLNDAIRETVLRWNAAGTGDAHDVAIPYDTDFGISVKAQSISDVIIKGKHRGPTFDPKLIQNEKFKAYIDAVLALQAVAPEAEAYGKFMYMFTIHLWSMTKALTRTDQHNSATEDEKFTLKVALKALGVKAGMP